MRKFSTVLVIFAVVVGVRAQLIPAPDAVEVVSADGVPPIRLMFTPPDLAGRFVLGIFDAGGSLVRRLVTDRDAAAFDKGLNGYITTWDGLDDAGQPCPLGKYSARGFVIGDEVVVRGEAFHFNDWIDEASDAAVTRVVDVELADQSNLIVLFEGKTGPVLERVPVAEGGAGWTVAVPGATSLEGLAGSSVRVRTKAGDRAYTLDDGAAVASDVQSGAGGLAPQIAGGRVTDWSAGFGETRWAVAETGALTAVVQIGQDGEILRTLPLDDAGFVPVRISASPGVEAIAVVEMRGEEQRVRVMVLETTEPTEIVDGRPVSDWRILLERMITPNENFGVVDGEAVASSGAASRPLTAEIALNPNDLDVDGQVLRLLAAFDAQGSYLATEAGLLLVRVSDRAGLTGVAAVPGLEAGSVRMFQGNGSVVEEFSILNLSDIAAFDCGDFQLAGFGAE